MKILYLSTSYVPYGRADSIQVVKMCHAFAQNGHQVTLISKNIHHLQEQVDDFQFYGVEPSFTIKKLPRPGVRGGGLLYSATMAFQLWRHRRKFDLVYSRDLLGGWIATKFGWPVIFEAHGFPPSNSFLYHCYHSMMSSSSFLRLVVISEGLRHDLEQHHLLPMSGNVVVAHDAADPVKLSKELVVPRDSRCHLGYVGHLYAGRGIELISELASRLNEYQFDVVGGTKEDIQYWLQRLPGAKVVFHGSVPPAKLAEHYQKMDILLMPYQKKVQVANGRSETSRWMSPMKMFEYMATGKPIISSDLPVLREVLTHEHNALLVPPDDIGAWVEAIKRLIADPDLQWRLGQNAQQDLVAHYTWQTRARRVLQDL